MNMKRCRASTLALLLLLVPVVKPVSAQSQNSQATTWFSLGLKEEDVKKKIAFYSKAIELDPFFVEALYNLGLAYKQEQNYPRAEQFLLKAYNAKPDRIKGDTKLKILYELAITYKKLRKLNDAVDALRGAKALATGQALQATISVELGRSLIQQGRYAEALVELREGQKLSGVDAGEFTELIQSAASALEAQPFYEAAEKARANGDLKQAKSLLEQARAKSPGFKGVDKKIAELDSLLNEDVTKQSYAALYDQAQKYFAEGNLQMAIATYESLVQQSANYKDAAARLQRAREQFDQQQHTEKLESEYATGLAMLKARDWTRAIIAFENVLQVDRTYRDVRRRLNEAQRGLDRESAETIIARYYADGITAMNQKDLGNALAAFEKVQKMNPNYRNVASLLAQVEGVLEQQTQTAKIAATTGVRLDSLYQEALIFQEKADWMQAVVAFEKIQLLQPDYRDVAGRLAQARMNLNLTKTPAKNQRQADSDMSSTLYVAGAAAALLVLPLLGLVVFSPAARARFYLLKGDYAGAAALYEKALTNNPQRVKLYPTLANIYLLMGRHDERALKVYKTILQLNLATKNREEITATVGQHYLSEGRTDSDAIDVLENLLKVEHRKLGKAS